MFILYGSKGSGSAAVEALLEELQLPYKLEWVARDADRNFTDAFKAISPLAQVPILKLPDGSHMSESAAMMIYLADLRPEAGLCPQPSDAARPAYLRVLLMLAASTYPAYLRSFYPARFTLDPHGAARVKDAALRDLWRDFSVLDGLLGEKQWFAGQFGAADIYAATLLSWFEDLPAMEARLPRLMAHYRRVKARPKIAGVFQRNEL